MFFLRGKGGLAEKVGEREAQQDATHFFPCFRARAFFTLGCFSVSAVERPNTKQKERAGCRRKGGKEKRSGMLRTFFRAFGRAHFNTEVFFRQCSGAPEYETEGKGGLDGKMPRERASFASIAVDFNEANCGDSAAGSA